MSNKAKQEFILTFNDGRTEHVTVSLRGIIAAERYLAQNDLGPSDAMPVTSGLYAVYWTMRHNGAASGTFDTWLDTIATFDTAGQADTTAGIDAPTAVAPTHPDDGEPHILNPTTSPNGPKTVSAI